MKIPLGAEVGLGPGDIVLNGDPAPLGTGKHPHFLAHVYCGKMAGWIKMPLNTEVDLGPRPHCVGWGPAPPRKGHSSPLLFDPRLLWPNGRPSQLLLNSCYVTEKLT